MILHEPDMSALRPGTLVIALLVTLLAILVVGREGVDWVILGRSPKFDLVYAPIAALNLWYQVAVERGSPTDSRPFKALEVALLALFLFVFLYSFVSRAIGLSELLLPFIALLYIVGYTHRSLWRREWH